jgi:hypothetical protein
MKSILLFFHLDGIIVVFAMFFTQDGWVDVVLFRCYADHVLVYGAVGFFVPVVVGDQWYGYRG